MKCLIYIAIISVLSLVTGCRQKRVDQSSPYLRTFEASQPGLVSGKPDTLKMGTMREGEKVTMEFLLRNGFDEPLVIEKVVSGCGCALFGYSRKPVAPGESAAMEVTFNSAGFYGEIIKESKIYTSACKKPYRIIIEAVVK